MPLGHPVKNDSKAFPRLLSIRWLVKDNRRPTLICALLKRQVGCRGWWGGGEVRGGGDYVGRYSNRFKTKHMFFFVFFFVGLSFNALDLLQATSASQKIGRKTEKWNFKQLNTNHTDSTCPGLQTFECVVASLLPSNLNDIEIIVPKECSSAEVLQSHVTC